MARLLVGEDMESYARRRKREEDNSGKIIVFGMASRSSGLSPPPSANQVAWFRFGVGITVTGAGVSTWADQSGNGNDLLQGTDANRPALQGDNTILFNGTSHFLKSVGFTLNQPETIYLSVKPITWTTNRYFFDGDTVNHGACLQLTSTPQIIIHAGSNSSLNTNATLGSYHAIACVFNGASMSITIDATAATGGNCGAFNMGGITLGAIGDGSGGWSNIQVKEMIAYSAAHDATTIAQVNSYLATL